MLNSHRSGAARKNSQLLPKGIFSCIIYLNTCLRLQGRVRSLSKGRRGGAGRAGPFPLEDSRAEAKQGLGCAEEEDGASRIRAPGESQLLGIARHLSRLERSSNHPQCGAAFGEIRLVRYLSAQHFEMLSLDAISAVGALGSFLGNPIRGENSAGLPSFKMPFLYTEAVPPQKSIPFPLASSLLITSHLPCCLGGHEAPGTSISASQPPRREETVRKKRRR